MVTTNPSPLDNVLQQTLEAGQTAASVSSVLREQLLPTLRSLNAPNHAGRRRELALAITEIETGMLWLGQYRRELQDQAAETHARLAGNGEPEGA